MLFEGRVVVVLTEHEAEKAVRYLLSQPIFGFGHRDPSVVQEGTGAPGGAPAGIQLRGVFPFSSEPSGTVTICQALVGRYTSTQDWTVVPR